MVIFFSLNLAILGSLVPQPPIAPKMMKLCKWMIVYLYLYKKFKVSIPS